MNASRTVELGQGEKKKRGEEKDKKKSTHLVHLLRKLIYEPHELLRLPDVDGKTPKVQEPPRERASGPVPLEPSTSTTVSGVAVTVPPFPVFVGANWA